MICFTCLRIMLYYYISNFRLIRLLKIPFLRILHKVLTIGTSMVLVKKDVTVLMQGLNSFPENVIYMRPIKEALLANIKLVFGLTASFESYR